MDGEVLAVRRGELFGRGGYFEGYIELARASGLERNIEANGLYLDRELLETNLVFKQIVTYCMLLSDAGTVFSYRRGGGEPRLKDKWSLGIGGHVHQLDTKPENLIKVNVMKNVEREVGVGTRIMGLRHLGYINCEDSPVNRDHLGLLFLKEVYDEHEIKANSPDILEGEFRSQAEIEKLMKKHEFEEWSEIAYRVLVRKKFKSSA